MLFISMDLLNFDVCGLTQIRQAASWRLARRLASFPNIS
jgi:hypothetical protein